MINAYGLKAIDVDIENTDEFESEVVQDRILNALKIVKQNNPGIRTILTFGTSTTGPTYWGGRLIERANALGANIDVFTIMPFDFGGGADMYGNTVNATEGLKTKLKSTFGWDDATAYAHIGISGMNGLSDQQETTTPAIWTQIRDWANSHHIARLAYWAVNRDRPCAAWRSGEQLLRHQPEHLAVHLHHRRVHRLTDGPAGVPAGPTDRPTGQAAGDTTSPAAVRMPTACSLVRAS